MKDKLKLIFIILLMLSYFSQGFSQRKEKTMLKETTPVAQDSNQGTVIIKDNSLFYNVRQFGAMGDSATIDSDAIDKAIVAAFKAGGGTVWFPAGKYLSYSLHLKSNITLFLDNGAYLIAAATVE
jgi:polygalacturonase